MFNLLFSFKSIVFFFIPFILLQISTCHKKTDNSIHDQNLRELLHKKFSLKEQNISDEKNSMQVKIYFFEKINQWIEKKLNIKND